VGPLGLGFGAGLLFGMQPQQALFLGLVLSATSVSISAQTLMELKVLRSRVGLTLLGAAVLDDVIVVLLLSIFTALALPSGHSGLSSVVQVILRMVLFLGGAIALGWAVFPKLSRKINTLPISQGLISFTLVAILVYGWAAEVLGGMAAITGAFLAGLLLARSLLRERIEAGILALAYGLFVPVFFINVGLLANLRQLRGESFWLFLGMTIVAVIGKLLGAGGGGLAAGLARSEALQLGIGMMSRGEVGLIVATVGVSQGLVSSEVFSAVVGVVILTTLLTPPALRWSFLRTQRSLEGDAA
jgi:Kef-type K+ transport system membrane component KefB